MNRVLQIAVIADDITGAADTGVQFCPAVGPIHMTGVAEGAFNVSAVRTAGVAVFTNTRHMDPARAADLVRMAAENVLCLKPRVVYKKIDSCLRGNVGVEIDSMLQATGATASFIAPAFPQQGRTTVNDVHLINGVPVAETEMARDPLCPVRESRLSFLLSAQSRMPVGHVDLASIEIGPVDLAERVRTLLSQGCRHIAFDAGQTVHLDAVAGLARDHFEDILLVGSAGLAGSLSRMMFQHLPCPAPADRPRIKKWLFVCGSASRVMADQVAMLARSTGWTHLALDPSALASGDRATHREQLAAQPVGAWGADGVILSIQPIVGARPVETPGRVIRGLAAVAADLLDAAAVEGLCLCGGDTAEAFWRQIGARGLLIREEILPSLMRGEFIGGPQNGFPVVTKAGAFGHADTLNQLIDSLK